ncbi:2771_t:CDS:10 [Ambispora gerdemannii]|uniref:2771_t:CDS:1 n=1 Tax=Ambispora gerdemannii TaxID=144530 RepID=A0A9N8YZQ0_9GLOM|nr:2771_t:CDS:10 [Ambispora gerdemannii]
MAALVMERVSQLSGRLCDSVSTVNGMSMFGQNLETLAELLNYVGINILVYNLEKKMRRIGPIVLENDSLHQTNLEISQTELKTKRNTISVTLNANNDFAAKSRDVSIPVMLVFCEYKSIKDLATECNISVIHTEQFLEGYQIYIVEQWVSDRKKPYNTVTIFTGDAKVYIINLEKEKLQPYPKKLQQLFDSLEQDNTRPKDTALGTIMVTNLSTLPSSLNMVLVPDGDYESNINHFYINLNLRKVGCSHRRALSLEPSSEAQQEKFIQIYNISTHIGFEYAVFELIKLVQTALYLFGLFPSYYIDGLLCDTTLDALLTFHSKFASSDIELRKNSLDNNNFLDRSLVAVLLSKVMSIRNKLSSLGYQVGKDPFTDPEVFLSGVASFQKSAKINATRFIDQYTVEKINQYKVFKKSKMEDLSNKVLKAKTEDIATCGSAMNDVVTDLDYFTKNVPSGRLKYLWKGKGKHNQNEVETDWLFGGREFGKSFLRNVTYKTAKTGEVFRGFKEGVTGLAHRKLTKDMFRELEFPGQSLIFRNIGFRDNDISCNMGFPPLDFESAVHTSAQFASSSSSLYNKLYETEISQNDQRLRRSRSFSSFETFEATRLYPDKVAALPKRSNSLPSIDIYYPEIIPRVPLKIDMQTNLLYDTLKQRKASLSELTQKLEDTSNKYAEQIEQFSQAYQKRDSEYKTAQNNALEVFSKQQSVGKMIKQIENNSAKLNYELAVLEDKLQEIEEFVDTFCLKVQFLELQMPQPSRFVQIVSQFCDYFQTRWNNILAPSLTNSIDDDG